MKKLVIVIIFLLLPGIASAQTTSSTNYQVEDGTFDSGGEPSSSPNYSSRDSIGDTSDSGVSSSNYNIFSGFFPSAFPGVPGTPTLTNTTGTMYNQLDFVVDEGEGQQSDTTYAIAISSDNFTTTYYIQADDTLGTAEAWQTYANWNSATGETVVGLAPNTTYKIKVKASYGSGSDAEDTETAFSPEASASTVGPDLTVVFSGVSSGTTVGGVTTTTTSTANAIAYGSLVVSTPKTAAHLITVTTNATNGYSTTVKHDDQLRTTSGSQIDPVSGTNASPAAWGASPSTGKFGYHSTDSLLCTGTLGRFSSSDTFAQLTTTPEEVACSAGPATAEDTYLIYKVEIGSLQPNGSYQNLVTYITTAQF